MFPRSVKCHDCGQIASVRGYGRIEYRWPETSTVGGETTIPTIDSVRLTIDCPKCGVTSQEFFPDGSSRLAPQTTSSVVNPDGREVRFQRIGPTRRGRSY